MDYLKFNIEALIGSWPMFVLWCQLWKIPVNLDVSIDSSMEKL